MAGVSQVTWTLRVPKFNIVAQYEAKFPREQAERNAQNLSSSLLRDYRLILLGRKVAQAFGVPSKHPWLVPVKSRWGPTVVVIPHPSGLCREYNDAAFKRRVTGMLRRELVAFRRDE